MPFLVAERVEYALDAGELVRGEIRGAIAAARPAVRVVDAPSEALRQGPAGVDWRIAMRRLFPTNLNHIAVRDGVLHLHNFHSDPPVDVYLGDVQLDATNVAWLGAAARGAAFELRGTATAMKSGSVEADVTLYRDTAEPSFDCALRIRGLRVPEWNALLHAYLGVDAQRGVARVDADLRARDGALSGVVTPALTDLRLLGVPGELVRQSALESVGESLIDLVVLLLRDQQRHVIEARIPVSGTIRHPKRDDWESARLLLRDAVVEGLKRLNEAVPVPGTS